MSPKRHELVEKLLRNPTTNTRTSQFRKLVEGVITEVVE